MPTPPLRPIDQLAADWRALRRSAASREAAHRLCEAEPAIAVWAPADLGDLVERLRAPRQGCAGRPGGGDTATGRDEAALVVRAMLRAASVHPLVPRAILQAVLPGLVSVARRLSWGSGGEWPDGGAFFVDAVTTAWDVISEWSGEDRRYAVLDLLSAVRCRLRRQLLRHRAHHERHAGGVDLEAVGAATWHGQPTDLDTLAGALDDHLGRGGVAAGDAAVLYAHRVLGFSMAELADLTGHSRRQLGARCARAAGALTA